MSNVGTTRPLQAGCGTNLADEGGVNLAGGMHLADESGANLADGMNLADENGFWKECSHCGVSQKYTRFCLNSCLQLRLHDFSF